MPHTSQETAAALLLLLWPLQLLRTQAQAQALQDSV